MGPASAGARYQHAESGSLSRFWKHSANKGIGFQEKLVVERRLREAAESGREPRLRRGMLDVPSTDGAQHPSRLSMQYTGSVQRDCLGRVSVHTQLVVCQHYAVAACADTKALMRIHVKHKLRDQGDDATLPTPLPVPPCSPWPCKHNKLA